MALARTSEAVMLALLVLAALVDLNGALSRGSSRLRNSDSEADRLDRLEIECSFKHLEGVIRCKNKNDPANEPSCPSIAFDLPEDATVFAIGTLRATPGSNPDTWYRLYPKKLNNNGWWDYRNFNKTKSSLMLHSKRKHSARASGLLVPEPICWESITKLLRFSKVSELFSVDRSKSTKKSSKVPILGVLRVVE